MIRLISQTAFQICLFGFLPVISLAQQKRTISLTAEVKNDTVCSLDGTITFKIHIRNTSSEIVLTPKRTILSPYRYLHSFINTMIEEIPMDQDCIKSVINDSSDIAPFRCNICFFGRSGLDYLNKDVKILPGEIFSLEESIKCYKFNPGGRYRIKFSLDSGKIDVSGQTDWIYIQFPYEHAASIGLPKAWLQ